MASIYDFVRYVLCVCVSKNNLCVCLLDYIVGASPPCKNMCVRSFGYIVGKSTPLCVLSLDPCMLPSPLCGIFSATSWKSDTEIRRRLALKQPDFDIISISMLPKPCFMVHRDFSLPNPDYLT